MTLFQFKREFNPILKGQRPTCQYRNWKIVIGSDIYDRKEYRCVSDANETERLNEICDEFDEDWACLTKGQLESQVQDREGYADKEWKALPDEDNNRHPYMRLWDFQVGLL